MPSVANPEFANGGARSSARGSRRRRRLGDGVWEGSVSLFTLFKSWCAMPMLSLSSTLHVYLYILNGADICHCIHNCYVLWHCSMLSRSNLRI